MVRETYMVLERQGVCGGQMAYHHVAGYWTEWAVTLEVTPTVGLELVQVEVLRSNVTVPDLEEVANFDALHEAGLI